MGSCNVPVQISDSSRDGALIAEVYLRYLDLVLGHTIEEIPEMTVCPEYQSVISSGQCRLFFSMSGGEFEAFEVTVRRGPIVCFTVEAVDASSTTSNSKSSTV